MITFQSSRDMLGSNGSCVARATRELVNKAIKIQVWKWIIGVRVESTNNGIKATMMRNATKVAWNCFITTVASTHGCPVSTLAKQ